MPLPLNENANHFFNMQNSKDVTGQGAGPYTAGAIVHSLQCLVM